MDEMPKPILAFCRSGARSGRLFALPAAADSSLRKPRTWGLRRA
jgi:protein tyrosine phosphatase (PTP) superfamily phosphohydrolase (DUF442 family)